MLDIAGAIFFTFYLASILIVVLRRAQSVHALPSALGYFLFWLALQLAIAIGARDLPPPLRPNLLMFAASVSLFAAAWTLFPGLRRTAAETPLKSLVALHAWRLGGFFFLVLYAARRAGWPFAPVAAIGDIITGALAAYIALRLARGRALSTHAIGAWNAFGLLDLLTAITLAVLSTPGAPFQIFTDVPQEQAFASLPWILVPVAIVPALIFVHLAIGLKLRNERPVTTRGLGANS